MRQPEIGYNNQLILMAKLKTGDCRVSNYKQLSLKERRQLACFLEMGLSVKIISSRLERHRSTIYREIDRNSTHQGYLAVRANKQALVRKHRKPLKLVVNSNGYKYVMTKLQAGWSPEQISGRMKSLKLPFSVCHETIYQYIYRHAHSYVYQYLPMQRHKRRQRGKRKSCSIYNGHRKISNRPEDIELRQTLGHWEGDTIRFASERKQSVTTLVERKSRFLVLQKNERSTTKIVMNNIYDAIRGFPKRVWHTITFDQGSEFADFARVERPTRCNVYYANARSPWQRGSNENTNKRLRRYLPKQADIKQISQETLDYIADKFNSTPRKCLGYLTPWEVLLGKKN